jgi:hypothetical protein
MAGHLERHQRPRHRHRGQRRHARRVPTQPAIHSRRRRGGHLTQPTPSASTTFTRADPAAEPTTTAPSPDLAPGGRHGHAGARPTGATTFGR